MRLLFHSAALRPSSSRTAFSSASSPAATSDEVRATERSAYGTEAVVAKGLGINISKSEQAKGVEGSVANWEARQPKTEKDK